MKVAQNLSYNIITEIIPLAPLDSPIMVVDWEESRPGALANREKFAPVSKRNRLISPPQLLIPGVPQE